MELADSRFIIHCTIACKNCEDFSRECVYCDEVFCALNNDYRHDKSGDVMCEECKEINSELVSVASEGIN